MLALEYLLAPLQAAQVSDSSGGLFKSYLAAGMSNI